MTASLDLDRLLRLRLIVARVGEMDLARWWNCKGVLSHLGAQVYRRGFPQTQEIARARLAFTIARSRCAALFDPPGSMTLWNLPPEVEDAFEDRWQSWLDQPEIWTASFEPLASIRSSDLLDALTTAGLLTSDQQTLISSLRRSVENRAVQIPGVHAPDDEVVTLLAAGFAKSDPGAPTIPYARLSGSA